MNAHRMNITIPRDLAEKLKAVPNKSAFIAEALREKLAARDGALAGTLLASAYREARREALALARDWDGLAGEGVE